MRNLHAMCGGFANTLRLQQPTHRLLALDNALRTHRLAFAEDRVFAPDRTKLQLVSSAGSQLRFVRQIVALCRVSTPVETICPDLNKKFMLFALQRL